MTIITKFYKHILIFTFFIIGANSVVTYFFTQQEQNYLSTQTELLHSKYKTQYKYLKIMSNDIFTMYQENTKLIELFAQAKDGDIQKQSEIRAKMYKMLQKRYKRLVRMGIVNMYFYLPNNEIFLCMNNPKKFRDNLIDFRENIVATNSSKKANDSFEVGKTSSGFQYVYPMFDKDTKHIGTLVISFSGNQLLEHLTNKIVVDKHFIILKSEVKKNSIVANNKDFYIETPEHQDYLRELNTFFVQHKDVLFELFENEELLEKIAKKIEMCSAFSVSGFYEGKAISITFIPIKNIYKKIAYIALYSNSEYLNKLVLESYYSKVLIFSIMSLLFIFSIYISITQNKLRDMALFDKLTKLPNRAFFYAELETELKRAKRLNRITTVMFIDLDGFKSVNDTFGHDVGDELLIQVSQRLKDSIREVDMVGRIGGDEFTVLLTDMKDEKDALIIAQKIINSLGRIFLINSNEVQIGASIGISSFPKDALDVDSLVKNADNAMYVAKNNGKNNYTVYNKEII